MNLIINDRIRKRNIELFNDFRVNLKYDSIASTFSFKFYFDPTNKEHAELACVSHFHEVIVQHNDETLITGYAISNAFNASSKKHLVEIAGYSKPGTLEDCDIPPTSLYAGCYPLETTGLSLKDIALKLLKPFSIGLVIDAVAGANSQIQFEEAGEVNIVDGEIQNGPGNIFASESLGVSDASEKKIDKANARQDQNIRSYLMELAVQRNIILSHDANGNLLFTEAKTNQKPIIDFDLPNGDIPGTSMSMSFNGQGMHSHIVVMSQADAAADNAGEETVVNPYCPILFRPVVHIQTSGTNVSLKEFGRQKLAAELKNVVLTIATDRWDINGALIKPNSIITVYNPECYIYNKATPFFVQDVEYIGDAKKMTAKLTCVPPEAYNKQNVKNLFVDAHRNFPRI
jgi:prophage tail gpP-like protein